MAERVRLAVGAGRHDQDGGGGKPRPDRLPNLIIPGVNKAGTTSLFEYLAQHPEICPATLKEPHYFSPLRYGDTQLRPLSDYAALFRHCRGELWRMEATPAYFYGGRRVAGAIARMLHRPRIVISLRDPVERIWSSFKMKKAKLTLGKRIGFSEYVAQALEAYERTGGPLEATQYRSLTLGLYADYIGEWWDVFDEDCRVVFFEHLSDTPASVVEGICDWLGIDAACPEDFDYSVHNKTRGHRSAALERLALNLGARIPPVLGRYKVPRSRLRDTYAALNRTELREDFDPQTRSTLEGFYRSSNEALAQQLVRRGCHHLPSWLARGVVGASS